MVLPERIWVCPQCRAQFVEAWRLKRHLMTKHGLTERRAWDVTDHSAYWLRVRRVAYVDETESDVGGMPHRDGRRRLKNG